MSIPVIVLLSIFILGVAVILLRTLTFARETRSTYSEKLIEIDTSQAAEHLSRAVQVETISFKEGQPPSAETLNALHDLLAEIYPLAHKHLKLEKINGFSLLYTWQGSRPELPGVLFMAHQDVVPVDPATLEAWTHPPFSGKIVEGSIWGRGTLDIKNQLTGALDAVEELLKASYQPERTIYLGFGHDEEIGGVQGTAHVARYLAEKGIRLEAVLDEGGIVSEGMLPGVSVPLALIGTAEKGYLTLELSVEAEPGHSSTPPRNTAIGILAKAITRLEETPLPAKMETIHNIFRAAGKHVPFLYRLVFANLWLTGGLVQRMMSAKGETNAILRTTTAATVISGGVKDNILPREAKAMANFRLISGETGESTIAAVKRIINDERVQVKAVKEVGWDPSPVSPADSHAFKLLEQTIRQFFDNAPVAPYLVLGATDSRYYYNVSKHVYRFTPLKMTSAALKMMHGIDEHISVAGLEKMVQFYAAMMQTWSRE